MSAVFFWPLPHHAQKPRHQFREASSYYVLLAQARFPRVVVPYAAGFRCRKLRRQVEVCPKDLGLHVLEMLQTIASARDALSYSDLGPPCAHLGSAWFCCANQHDHIAGSFPPVAKGQLLTGPPQLAKHHETDGPPPIGWVPSTNDSRRRSTNHCGQYYSHLPCAISTTASCTLDNGPRSSPRCIQAYTLIRQCEAGRRPRRPTNCGASNAPYIYYVRCAADRLSNRNRHVSPTVHMRPASHSVPNKHPQAKSWSHPRYQPRPRMFAATSACNNAAQNALIWLPRLDAKL